MSEERILVTSHAPRIEATEDAKRHIAPGYGWASSNWSGYALGGADGSYHSITGDWIVPAVKRSLRPTYSAAWIGIDGFNNGNLIQAGTEQDFLYGKARYSAWWEILPAASITIPEPVDAGDHMYSSIVNNNDGTWSISLENKTKGWTFVTIQAYSGPGASAEWIMEAPMVNSHLAKLADYGQTVFNPGTINGGNPDLVKSDGGIMIQRRKQVSTPSYPDSDTDGFRMAYGAITPLPNRA